MADAVPALSALPRAETPVWGFARTRPADLGPLWASLDAADDAVGEALRVVDTLPTTARGVVEGATTSADLGSAVWLLSASSTDPAVAVEARSDRWRAAREELWQRTREARESAASLMGRFAPEVASVDVEPVRQELREASTSFFIGRKGRLVRAAAPVLAHLRPGAEVDPKTLPAVVEEVARVRRLVGDIALSWRRLPGCAALDPAVNVLSEAGWQAVSDAVSAVERDRDLLAGLPANLSDGVQASRRFGEPLGPSEHRTLDAAGRALSAAVTHTGGSSEDEARFARGRGVLRTWAATRGRASRGPATGRRLGAMGRGERGAGAAGRGVGRGALGVVDRRGVTGRRTGGPRPGAGRGVGGGAVGRGGVRVVRGGPSGPDGQSVRRRVGAAAVLPDHGTSGGPAGSPTVPAGRVLRQGRRTGAGDRADAVVA